MKPQINSQYIAESIRIRTDYLEAIKNMEKKTELLNHYMDEIKRLSSIFKIDEVTKDNQEEINNQLNHIEDYMDLTRKQIQPLYDTIEELKKASSILYDSIKEKYPTLTAEDIKEQIIPHVADI